MTLIVQDLPSPNHGSRREAPIDLLIIHYTGMADAAAALARLTDAASEVSAHYLIAEDGAVVRLVPESARAWHAGRAYWAGTRDVNSRSIGIELVNPGHEGGPAPYPPPQMAALSLLARDLVDRHPIPPHRVLGHSDVAPDRKRDPGEWFDWAWLASQGIGLWPAWPAAASQPPAASERDLRHIGYETGDEAAVRAFQRHWRPTLVDGRLDAETCARIAAIAALVPDRQDIAPMVIDRPVTAP